MLEEALSSVADAPVDTVCAGRTDAGVHARCQVVHFDSDAAREPRGWMLGSTSRLPQAVCVRWCVPVADDFSARFSARRSEEHTSELQSLMRISYAVFCLKKKKSRTSKTTIYSTDINTT